MGNAWGNMMGGAATGAGTGAMFGGNPYAIGAGALIGGTMGLLQGRQQQKQNEAQNYLSSEQTRYSPWTGQQGNQNIQQSNGWNAAMQGVGAGVQQYGAYQNQQNQQQMMDAYKDRTNAFAMQQQAQIPAQTQQPGLYSQWNFDKYNF